MEFIHVPVLLNECIEALDVKKDKIYVDCTIGGGGHSQEILKRGAKVIGIDRDQDALSFVNNRLSIYGQNLTLVHDNFKNLKNILSDLGIKKVDGILVDLGVSSYQLDNCERGFSFRENAKLDMRMDQTSTLTAQNIVNQYSEAQLKDIIKTYGEEKFASSIAKHIVKYRATKPIETTFELRDIVLSSVVRNKHNSGMNNVQRTFQAIRIAVNGELDGLKQFITDATEMLDVGGRLAIISFHSLEDRIVKQTYKELSTACICPPDFPICVCGHKATIKLINKFTTASQAEIEKNSRSSSAKLRIAEKI